MIAALVFLDRIGPALIGLEPNPGRAVADFHTAFNLVLAALFLPLLKPYAALLRRWLPSREAPTAGPKCRPLCVFDPAAGNAGDRHWRYALREALRLVDVLTEMLVGARDIIASGEQAAGRRNQATRRHPRPSSTAVKKYLTSIDPDDLGEAEQRRLMQVLAFTMNIEQAGDVVDSNLLPHAAKRLKRGLAFSLSEKVELTRMMDRLLGNLKTAASLFMTEDPGVARRLADEKVAFREAEAVGMAAHLARLRSGHLATAQASALHVDLLRDAGKPIAPTLSPRPPIRCWSAPASFAPAALLAQKADLPSWSCVNLIPAWMC